MKTQNMPTTNTQKNTPTSQTTRAFQSNHIYEFRGTLHIDYDDYYDPESSDPSSGVQVTYGIRDLSVWHITQQKFIALSDRYYVTAESLDIAKQEFWTRFHAFARKYTRNAKYIITLDTNHPSPNATIEHRDLHPQVTSN